MSPLQQVYFCQNQGINLFLTAVILLIMRIEKIFITLSLAKRGFSEWTQQLIDNKKQEITKNNNK